MDYKELLKNNVCQVVFKKVDGSERTMKCTLKADMIPTVESKNTEKKRTKKSVEGIIPVYDLENNGWRSFKEESVISFDVI